MAVTKRDRIPFKERSELLDFLLEVAAVTAETLDLDRLLAAVVSSTEHAAETLGVGRAVVSASTPKAQHASGAGLALLSDAGSLDVALFTCERGVRLVALALTEGPESALPHTQARPAA